METPKRDYGPLYLSMLVTTDRPKTAYSKIECFKLVSYYGKPFYYLYGDIDILFIYKISYIDILFIYMISYIVYKISNMIYKISNTRGPMVL